MITVFRYRTMKPRDGKIELTFHRDGTIVGFSEYWHRERGWEVVVDVLVDTSVPVERRRFFLCTGGDNLDPLGDNAFAYHVGTHESKGYCSFLFDVSHLPDQVVGKLEANWERLGRTAPAYDDLSYKGKRAAEKESKLEEKKRRVNERAERERRAREQLERQRVGTDQLVASREAADETREMLETEAAALETPPVPSVSGEPEEERGLRRLFSRS